MRLFLPGPCQGDGKAFCPSLLNDRLPRYPMRRSSLRFKVTRRGSNSERLLDARRWAASVVVGDLAQILFLMVAATQALLFGLWSVGAIHSTHPITANMAQRTIVIDVVDDILRTIPTLELQDVFGLTQSEVFSHSILYRLVLFALRIGVLIPIVSAQISPFGLIRTFNPSQPIVEDQVVQTTVSIFTSTEFHTVSIHPQRCL